MVMLLAWLGNLHGGRHVMMLTANSSVWRAAGAVHLAGGGNAMFTQRGRAANLPER